MEGDGLALDEEACQLPGSKGCGIAEATDREVAEETVHGCVQLGVCSNQNNHPEMCNKNNEINNQKRGK